MIYCIFHRNQEDHRFNEVIDQATNINQILIHDTTSVGRTYEKTDYKVFTYLDQSTGGVGTVGNVPTGLEKQGEG